MSSLDFFAFDIDDIDDVNELLEHHSYSVGYRPHHTPSSTSARDLLSRMQFAQVMQQQQQHAQQQHQQSVVTSTGPSQSFSNNLVDGLMNDDWPNNTTTIGGSELFEFEDAALMGGANVGSPDHAIGGGPIPLLPSSSTHVAPTMEDIVAAYWHGRATGAMASAASSVPGANPTNRSAAAPTAPTAPHPPFAHHHHHHHPFRATAERTPTLSAIPLPRSASRSATATALTANLAAANALATTEALNAQLFQHWLQSGGAGTGNMADGAAAVVAARPSWDPSASSSAEVPSEGFSWDPSVGRAPPAFSPRNAGAPFSSPPLGGSAASSSPAAQSYLAQLLAASEQESMTASTAAAAFNAPSTTASSRNRRMRDVTTASSLLESRLELARANAFANAQHHRNAAAAAAANNTTNNNSSSSSALLSSLLDFEDLFEDSLPGGDGEDSIGTVDEDDDDDDEETDTRLLLQAEARETATAGVSGINEPSFARTAAAAPSSSTTANSQNTTANSGSTTNNNETANREDESTTATATPPTNQLWVGGVTETTTPTAPPAPTAPIVPPRRSRRQAAVRGLERISTALATHGMGGGSDADDDRAASSAKARKDAAKSNAKTAAQGRKKTPTIIPKPSNRLFQKELVEKKELQKEERPPVTCCICLEEPTHDELAGINGCSHPFCFTCIETWADQENSCPLCKARFFKIDRRNKPAKKRKGVGGCVGEEDDRSSKRVRNRDQRSDPSFVNPLEGIFASMEANGTWPTHIAQLLFSGLGASSLGGGNARRHLSDAAAAASAAQHRSPAALASHFPPPSTSAFAMAAARRQQQRRQHPASGMASTFRFHPLTGGNGGRTATAPVVSGSTSSLMGEVARAEQGQRYGGTFSTATAGGTGGSDPSSSTSPFHGTNPFAPPPHSRPCPRRRTATERRMATSTAAANNPHNPFSSVETNSPWSASASVSVTLGPHGFAGRRSSSSSTSTTSFQTFPNPTSANGRMASSSTNTQTSSPFLSGEEEEELLSTLSPSSYIQRLHRELEGSSATAPRHDRPSAGQYQFNAFPSFSSRAAGRRNNTRTAPGGAPSPSDNPFGMFSAPPGVAPSSRALPFHGVRGHMRHRTDFSGHDVRMGGSHLGNRNNAAAAHGGAAGRSMETALEIDSDDDDDDVVEVIDVEALI
mmetsp:Transcript_35736/g.64355  ORF Transcript_35736/g.64355 Transcript_35736/m.64355 type:complete len:1166 (-) Transcript_35736:116-3613(-)